MKQPRILHLTHTDIQNDSRILKEIYSAEQNGFQVVGLGAKLEEGTKNSNIRVTGQIESFDLLARRLKLPKLITHVLVMIELSLRMLFQGPKTKPDIIHCNDTLVLPIGAILKLICRAKLIYDAHELESQKNGSTRITSWVTLTIERVLWRWVDALIVVSPSIENWYHHHLGNKNSTIVLNSPMIHKDLEKTSYLRDRFLIPADHTIFMYLGILGPGRGIEDIVSVFSRPGLKASIVFMGYGPMQQMLETESHRIENVYLHEGVEHEMVVPITTSADVGMCFLENISLSDYYSLPNKFFEYIFSEVPVIASDFPDLRACIDEYDVGICIEFTKEALEEAVDKFVSRKKNISITQQTLKPLHWNAQSQALVDIYRSVLK